MDPWCKRLVARLPPLGSRVRIAIIPRRFNGGRNGIRIVFSLGFSCFPLPQISFHLLHTHFVNFILSAPVGLMVRQAWSTGILAIHRPSIKGSFFDPALCRIRLEDIYSSYNSVILPWRQLILYLKLLVYDFKTPLQAAKFLLVNLFTLFIRIGCFKT